MMCRRTPEAGTPITASCPTCKHYYMIHVANGDCLGCRLNEQIKVYNQFANQMNDMIAVYNNQILKGQADNGPSQKES